MKTKLEVIKDQYDEISIIKRELTSLFKDISIDTREDLSRHSKHYLHCILDELNKQEYAKAKLIEILERSLK